MRGHGGNRGLALARQLSLCGRLPEGLDWVCQGQCSPVRHILLDPWAPSHPCQGAPSPAAGQRTMPARMCGLPLRAVPARRRARARPRAARRPTSAPHTRAGLPVAGARGRSDGPGQATPQRHVLAGATARGPPSSGVPGPADGPRAVPAPLHALPVFRRRLFFRATGAR